MFLQIGYDMSGICIIEKVEDCYITVNYSKLITKHEEIRNYLNDMLLCAYNCK